MQVEIDLSEDGEVIQMKIVNDDKSEYVFEMFIDDCRDLIVGLSDCMIKANEIKESLKIKRRNFN